MWEVNDWSFGLVVFIIVIEELIGVVIFCLCDFVIMCEVMMLFWFGLCY